MQYKIESFPASRQFTFDIGRLSSLKHHVQGLIEIDVTDARVMLRKRRVELGRGLSLTSWMLKCIGQAVSEFPHVHALKGRGNNLVIFPDIDISLVVEKTVEGARVPLPMVIRGVQNKSISALHAEIEAARNQETGEGTGYVLGASGLDLSRIFSRFPQFLRLAIWRLMLSNPARVNKTMGTVMVTSVGMVGAVSGWFVPRSIHPLCIAAGSIVKKPGVVKGSVQIREFLQMTLLIDHDVIDGVPAARFVVRLKELMERGFGLSESLGS